MFCWHNTRRVPPGKGTGRPAVRGIHNSYCAGVVVYNQHICAHRSFAIGKGGLERQMLRRWGFDFAAAVVVHRVVPAAEEIEHRMVTAAAVVHKVASVGTVAHREVFVVDTDNFGMEVALHIGWVVVTALLALFHSW